MSRVFSTIHKEIFSGKTLTGLCCAHMAASTSLRPYNADTLVPTVVKNGLAYFPGAVSAQRLSDGERQEINSHLRHQRGYDSVNIISNGQPVTGGLDLEKTPVIAGVIGDQTKLVGVRPDCVHMTTREGGQLHTSHSDKMKFDLRCAVHLGADVLLHGTADPTKSTGDLILSGEILSSPLERPMRSKDAYLATLGVLGPHGLRHGIANPGQASLSVIATWSEGRGAFNLFRSKTSPLAESFPELCGVKAVDGEQAFKITTDDRVPPKRVKERIRQAGDFTEGASLFQAPPDEQASTYHWLGITHGALGGRYRCSTISLDRVARVAKRRPVSETQ